MLLNDYNVQDAECYEAVIANAVDKWNKTVLTMSHNGNVMPASDLQHLLVETAQSHGWPS